MNTTQHNTTCSSLIQTGRVQWIDDLKFWGIYLVILGHNVLENKGLFNFIYMFHMPLFFFASGMVCKYRMPKQEVKHSFKILLVPYFFLYLIQYVLAKWHKVAAWILHGKWNMFPGFAKYTGKAFLGIFVGFDTRYSAVFHGALGFLKSLFFCRVIFSLVEFLAKKVSNKKSVSFVFHIAASILCELTIFLLKGKARELLHINILRDPLCVYPYFCLGHFCFPYLKNFFSKNSVKMKCFECVLCIVFFVVSYKISLANGMATIMGMQLGNNGFLLWSGCTIAIMAMLLFANLFSPLPKWTLFFSQNTLLIMSFHLSFSTFLVYRLVKIFCKTFNQNSVPTLQAIVISIFSLLLCAIPIYIIRRFFPFVLGDFEAQKQIKLQRQAKRKMIE